MTVGNALRRVLLSSLEGAAPISVKIKGVSHEFSTIPNVKEDVVQIILNIKQLRLKLHGDGPKTITLSVQGAKEAKASDIKAPSEVEIINPDLHIATLDNDKAELVIEIEVDKGRGYEPVEKREGAKSKIGTIAIDSVYSPVQKVRYDVEATRLGQMIDLDKLTVDIETDGTITPEEAIKRASLILIDHFNLLAGNKPIVKEKAGVPKEREKMGTQQESENVEIEELDLSARTMNALLANNVKTVGQALDMGAEVLSKLKGLGKKAVEELNEKIKELGLELK
jgi:DNA-directed RNA polymerase subunit alpha